MAASDSAAAEAVQAVDGRVWVHASRIDIEVGVFERAFRGAIGLTLDEQRVLQPRFREMLKCDRYKEHARNLSTDMVLAVTLTDMDLGRRLARELDAILVAQNRADASAAAPPPALVAAEPPPVAA